MVLLAGEIALNHFTAGKEGRFCIFCQLKMKPLQHQECGYSDLYADRMWGCPLIG